MPVFVLEGKVAVEPMAWGGRLQSVGVKGYKQLHVLPANGERSAYVCSTAARGDKEWRGNTQSCVCGVKEGLMSCMSCTAEGVGCDA
jgi:hypothetical protein